MKKMPSKPIRRLIALMTAAVLSLQLSGCGWGSLPWPATVTKPETSTAAPETATAAPETSSEAASPEAASTGAPSGTLPESSAEETLPESTEEESLPESSEEAVSSEAEISTAADVSAPGDESTAANETEVLSSSEDPSAETSSADDPTEESTPGETSPVPESFSVNYYRTPDILREVAGDVVLVDAYNLIDAFLAGKTTVSLISPKEEAGRILYVADTLCPLLKAFSDISEESWKDGAFSWNFYVNKVEMSIVRAEFEAQIAEYIEPGLSGGYSETERALLLYHAYTEPASYNYTIISGAFQAYSEAEQHRIHSAFAGIMDHTGVCHDLAGGMTFLFIQAGFNAGRVSVFREKSEHSWTLIELDGRYTFCDATWDVGGYFSFFGNSVAERGTERGGRYLAEEMNLYDLNAPEHFDIVDPGFGKLHDYSYSRYQNGLSLSLTIDTDTAPHRLIFSSTRAGDRFTMTCP